MQSTCFCITYFYTEIIEKTLLGNVESLVTNLKWMNLSMESSLDTLAADTGLHCCSWSLETKAQQDDFIIFLFLMHQGPLTKSRELVGPDYRHRPGIYSKVYSNLVKLGL